MVRLKPVAKHKITVTTKQRQGKKFECPPSGGHADEGQGVMSGSDLHGIVSNMRQWTTAARQQPLFLLSITFYFFFAGLSLFFLQMIQSDEVRCRLLDDFYFSPSSYIIIMMSIAAERITTD